jgi:acyl-CoA thioesterase
MPKSPSQIVSTMYEKDYFSQWLGIEVIESSEGKSILQMKVKKEMLNGFGIAHGGITYSLADSALAFASNSHGKKAVSIETNISHLKTVHENDLLRATAHLKSISNKIGLYEVEITNGEGILVALFKGTVYRTREEW